MIFPGFSKKFQVYFLNIFNVASNYFWINVYIKNSPNQKYIISTVSQGSHISGLTKFHDISLIFIIFCKIPIFFQVFQVYYIFPGFPVNVGTLQRNKLILTILLSFIVTISQCSNWKSIRSPSPPPSDPSIYHQ